MTPCILKCLAFTSILLVVIAVELSEDKFFKGTKKEFNEYLKKLHKQIDVSGPGLLSEQLRILEDITSLLAEVKKLDSCFAFTLKLKGSSVDGLKIGFPDEFDFGLENPEWTGKIVLENDFTPPGYGYAVDKDKKTCLKDYLVENRNYVDPAKVRGKLRELVEEAMRNLNMDGRIKNLREGGPAVTFEEITPNERKFPFISIDLAIAIDLTKWPKGAKDLPPEITSANAEIVPKVSRKPLAKVWLISFAKTEAKIIKDIDKTDGGSRKKVLQLAKYLKSRSIGQGFAIASYHLKMIFIHLTSELTQPGDWTEDKIADRFMDLINRLLYTLRVGSLRSYFMEGHDIFRYRGIVDLDSARKSITIAIEKMKEDPKSFLPENDRPQPRHKTHPRHHHKKPKKPYYILNI